VTARCPVTAVRALQRAGWRHPEAAAAGVAAAAWALLLMAARGTGTVPHAGHHLGPQDVPASGSFLVLAAGWLVMSVAMMVPGALPAARHLALGALWPRRQRTVGIFLSAYLAVWAAFGAVAHAALWAAGRVLGIDAAALLLPVALASAAVWQVTPQKWYAARACHLLPPLPPRGVKADLACATVALRYGRNCVTSCWPIMLGMVAAGHGDLGLMALLTVIVSAEKVAARPGRLAVPTAAVLVLAAVVSA
jgi:predicted metal-binding membrane protein